MSASVHAEACERRETTPRRLTNQTLNRIDTRPRRLMRAAAVDFRPICRTRRGVSPVYMNILRCPLSLCLSLSLSLSLMRHMPCPDAAADSHTSSKLQSSLQAQIE